MNKILRIGAHIHSDCDLEFSADYSKQIGSNFFQIFLANPQKYNSPRFTGIKLLQLRKKLIEYDIMVVIHANFMLNFCNECESYKHKAAVKLLEQDLRDSVKLGAIGVVIHMGKKLKMDEDVAIANYVKGVQTALSNTPEDSIVIFETGAGVGSEVCTDIIDLGLLYRKFTKQERKRIKFCIDTCHIYSAGYDIGNLSYVDVFCGLVDVHLSWNKVACIHLNDSKCPLNSCKDRHADINCGFIEKYGLKKFVKICYDKNIPMVLETPCDTIKKTEQITMIKNWIL